MKKVIAVLVVLMFVAPVMGTTISVVQQSGDPNLAPLVLVRYQGAGVGAGNRPRSFALDISVDNSKNISSLVWYKTGESISTNKGYGIFPSSIQIDANGTVTSWGTPLVYAIPDDNAVAEMGSLFVGEANAPSAPDGNLFSFRVSGDCNITIGGNALRGNVLKENGQSDTNYNGTQVKCLKPTDPGYSAWNGTTFNRPNCWCFRRQCRGDGNGTAELLKWVSAQDLSLFKMAFGKADTVLKGISSAGTPGICADNNHTAELLKRVSGADLSIFKLYFGKATTLVPQCPGQSGNIFTWKN